MAAVAGMATLQVCLISVPGIAGRLPPEWARLEHLEDLRLAQNKLTGT